MQDELPIITGLPFTTTDATNIKLLFGNELILCLTDWMNRKVKLIFPYTLGFKFENMGTLEYRDDQIYTIKNSKWLNEQLSILKKNNTLDVEPKLHHIRFCFNATDEILDVIFDEDEGYRIEITD